MVIFYFLVRKLGLFKVCICRYALTQARTHTHKKTHICTGAAHSNVSGSQKSFLQVCSTRLDLSSLLGHCRNRQHPPDSRQALHHSHRALQELQVNLLQSWIRASASAAVRPEIQDLFDMLTAAPARRQLCSPSAGISRGQVAPCQRGGDTDPCLWGWVTLRQARRESPSQMEPGESSTKLLANLGCDVGFTGSYLAASP